MKTSRTFSLAFIALLVGFLLAHWCVAQPATPPPSKEPASYDFGTMEQLASFVTYLQDTKQTNTLQRFNDYLNASLASHHYVDLGMNLIILQRLRDGRTNLAYELLEGRLDSDIVAFVDSYRQLPVSAQAQPGLKMLKQARDYRAKFPFKEKLPIIDEGVENAFKILDEKAK
jgi:hypothetical protein